MWPVPEIHIFCLKSQFLREIPEKARNPDFRENHMGRLLIMYLNKNVVVTILGVHQHRAGAATNDI